MTEVNGRVWWMGTRVGTSSSPRYSLDCDIKKRLGKLELAHTGSGANGRAVGAGVVSRVRHPSDDSHSREVQRAGASDRRVAGCELHAGGESVWMDTHSFRHVPAIGAD